MALTKLPAFVAVLLFMYWSIVFLCFGSNVSVLRLWGKRNDMLGWSIGMLAFFRASVHRVGDTELYRTSQPIMYLANHRSWADFFLDVYTTEGRSALLSRWAVFGTFPIFLTSALILKGIIFFKRNVAIDKGRFNAMLDRHVANSPRSGLVVYPEGHRNLRETSLPLKRGMLHYAHLRNMPVQVVITAGKELLLSETQLSAGFGAHLRVGYSKVIHPAQCSKGFDQFVQLVQQEWDETWARVYAADASGPLLLPALDQGAMSIQMPLLMRVQQLAWCCFSLLALLGISYFCLRIVLWSGFYARVLYLGVLGATAASLHLAEVPDTRRVKQT